jgi:hypothetical protein
MIEETNHESTIPGPDLVFMALVQRTLLLEYYCDTNLISSCHTRAGENSKSKD